MTATATLIEPRRGRPRPRGREVSTARMTGRVIAGVIIAFVFLIPYLIMLIGSFKSRSNILAVPPT